MQIIQIIIIVTIVVAIMAITIALIRKSHPQAPRRWTLHQDHPPGGRSSIPKRGLGFTLWVRLALVESSSLRFRALGRHIMVG